MLVFRDAASGLERILWEILVKRTLVKSMDRCIGRHDTIETIFKMELNIIQSVIQMSGLTIARLGRLRRIENAFLLTLYNSILTF